MSFILSIYSKKAFKEVLLPAIDNADYSVLVPGNLFGMIEDIEIDMEIMDGRWKFQPSERYYFEYNTTNGAIPYNSEILKNGDILSGSIVGRGREENISVIVHEVESLFQVSRKLDLYSVSQVTIGKEAGNIIQYDSMALISRNHATIVNRGGIYVVEDHSANGTFVNSKRIMGSYQLSYGDCIDIFGLRIVFLNSFIAVSSSVDAYHIMENTIRDYQIFDMIDANGSPLDLIKKFHRSPRSLPKIETEGVEIEAPPAPRILNQQPAFMAIGPSLTMALPMLMGCALSIYSTKASGGKASAFMFTGLVTAVGSALVGTTWAIISMKNAKKKNREDELKRFEAYSEYLINISNELKQKYENNMRGLRQLYPEAGYCCNYNENSVELWNRNARHDDFLSYRLGTGSIPFQVGISIPKEKFDLINDSLAEKPKLIKESFSMLHDVPVCVDLFKHKLVGLVGGIHKNGCYPVMHALVSQIAASNCYTDVKMVFIYDEGREENTEQWGFAKWLPHVWSEDRKTRYVASNRSEASEVFYELTKILRIRSEERKEYGSEKIVQKPYYIMFIENLSFLEGELITKYIQDDKYNCGVTTILMTDGYENLPNTCEFIIENGGGYCGTYNMADGTEDRTGICFDMVSASQVENFARRLSCIEVNETETGGEIPNVLTFFDMYGVHHPYELNVIDRWKKNRTYETMKALVGQKAGGANCFLDVHEKYHGPHGLVAGTTGSGKSETLQTYMLSLALNYSPDDIGFFIIDYKGGGMANLFNGLPHMIGQISNLSGNQVHRAMVSIKSENMRRQRIFTEHGVNNINLYTRLYKNNEASIPIPHMFIIIDEFAELKREEPDFMRELISVAQVGRSLGVHLILATQKPAGTVDDNIWSNSKFRLCLRVQDRQDSTDMLHRPDAAYITQAGRCFMQVGNDELFELFQSAWSGAVYDENAGTVQTNIAKMLSGNGKAALVGSHAQIKMKENLKYNWIRQILQVLNDASRKSAIAVADCSDNSALSEALTREFFKAAEKAGIEYPVSDYNTRRVQDFITVVGDILVNHDGVKDMASGVISRAISLGKKLPEMKEKTQLDAVVEYLGKVAKENGYVHNLQLWLPVLPEELYLEQLSGYKGSCFDGTKWPATNKRFTLSTIVGMYDDPVNQAQQPFSIDIATNGNHAIIGTVTSGKSTFLVTYIYSLVNRYSPDAVNLYLIDFSSKALGSFAGLPHVGGVMFESDEEKISKFFTMISKELEERKRLFQGGNYSQYIQANGLVVPAVIIVIDNMSSFRTKTNDAYEDIIITLLKEGVGYGIFFMVTAAGFGLSEIPVRIGDNFRTVVCLEMNDKFGYSEALRTFHLDVLPESNIKGRGLAKVGEAFLEFQTALSIPAEDDYERGKQLKEFFSTMSKAWTGKRAKAVPVIPENPVWDEFCELSEVKEAIDSGRYLPIGYDQKYANSYNIDLLKTYTYAAAGHKGTGKTNMLKNIAMAAKMAGGEVVIIDFNNELNRIAKAIGATYIDSDQGIFDYINSIIPTFQARKAKQLEGEENGLSDEELFESMQEFSKIFIIIDDLLDFSKHVHYPAEGVPSMFGGVCNLLQKGSKKNVFWFAGVSTSGDDETTGKVYSVFCDFTEYKAGIHFGGNVTKVSSMDYSYINYNEQNKLLEPGIGLLPANRQGETNMVVVPLNKA